MPGVAPDGRQYAEWIWRVLAYIIDYIPAGVLAGIGYLFAILLTSTSSVVRQGELYGTPYSYTTVERSTSAIGLILAFIFYLLALAYWIWVDFAICYIGVLWPLWDAKRQCLLSDKVTGAVVYKD